MKRSRTLFEFSFKKRSLAEETEETETDKTCKDTTNVNTSTTDSTDKDRYADDGNQSDGSMDDDASQNARKKKPKIYQQSWKTTWVWLEKGDKGMSCSICRKHKKQNTFTEGCMNYRTSTLKRHVKSTDHVNAVRAESLQKHYAQAQQEAVRRSCSDTKAVAAMTTVFWMAKEDIPINKYTSLVNLQIQQGCEALKNISSAGQNATYMSRSAGEEFQECVAEDIHESVVRDIRNADMFSVLVDESTDVAVCKQMVVYVRIVDDSFEPKTCFLKNITIDNPKSDASVLFSALKNCLRDEGLNLENCKGFGSDGASVMVGKHHGVARRVKDESPHCIGIHCMAHRFNLATSQASKNITYMKDFEKTVSDLYYYFGGSKSGNRKCELEAIQKILEDPQVKIKECHQIRWIAFYDAVNAVYRSWNSLVTYFKSHEDKTAKSFTEKLTDLKFVSILHLLMDILPSLAQMSMVLQKQDIDIAAVKPALDGVKNRIKLAKKGTSHYQEELQTKMKKETKKNKDGDKVCSASLKGHALHFRDNFKKTSKDVGEVRVTFCDNLHKNISDRFPSEAVTVASAFHILGMRPLSFVPDKENYGKTEMEILIAHYGNEAKSEETVSPSMIDGVKCLEEWQLAKQLVLDQLYPRDNLKQLWKLMFNFHKDVLPNLTKLAKLCLIMPYQTADCERGFSCQNAIKTAKRNRLKEKHLNTLMTIKCEGGPVSHQDFSSAIQKWKGKKDRRLYNH